MRIKKVLSLIIIIGILFCGYYAVGIIYNEINLINEYFKIDSEYALPSYISNQYKINQDLMNIQNDKQYTLSNAYVMVNPYGISPLSAIIIFNTEEQSEIDVYLNNEYITKMESSTKHLIPIYGLKEGNNTVTLKSKNESQSYSIKVENIGVKIDNNILNSVEDKVTFFDSVSQKLIGVKNDDIVFYLNLDNHLDIEWLDNGHLLIGSSEGGTDYAYTAFVEMDYLGKVYNYYIPEYGLYKSFQVINNNELMLLGKNEAVYGDTVMLYTIDLETGRKVSKLNISSLLSDVEYNLSNINSFYFDSLSDDVIIYIEDKVISISMITKDINWIKNRTERGAKKYLEFENRINNYFVNYHELYSDITENTKISKLSINNNMKFEDMDTTFYRSFDLKKSVKWNYSVELMHQYFYTDYRFEKADNVDLCFLSKTGFVHCLNYKKANSEFYNRIFNINLSGNYRFFIKVNDQVYDTEKVYSF